MTPNKIKPLNAVRKEAWRILDGVTIGEQQTSELTQDPQHIKLAPPDRAAALRLALMTLRFADRCDWAMKPFLARKPHETIQNLLRLGVAEVSGSGAAAHGVVNDLVALCGRSNRTAGHKGMVNAVLRKAIEKVEGKWDKSPIPKTPKWLRKPLAEAYGNQVLQKIEAAHCQIPPFDLSVKDNAESWARKFDGKVLPNGTVRIASGQQVSALEGYDTGEWWIQDAAAAMAMQMCGDLTGKSAIDLCAAPGGKTMQLAAAGANVTALDLSATRLERVSENLTRTGLKAMLETGNALDYKTNTFDLVLLDAPCSATGTLRRHPDLPFAHDGSEISKLIELQASMLAHAATLIAEGGVLIFCTCSLIPDEGEVQVEDFLANNTDFEAVPFDAPWIDDEWRTQEGGVRLRPDYWSDAGGMDGFYIARLKRKPN